MKFLNKLVLFFLCFGIVMVSCEGIEDSLTDDRLDDNPLPTAPTYSAGTADFSKFVSIGNSLTAGFMDGALYTAGQANSLPAQMARSFAAVGGGAFNQPDINSVNGFNSTFSDVPNGVIAGRTLLDTSIPGPVPTTGELPTAFAGDRSALNNFGVPGILLGQALSAGTGTPGNMIENGLYTRFASNPGTSTILGDAIAAQPTFMSIWIGNNDVLGYAVSGASNEAIFTSVVDFQTQFNGMMAQILANTSANGIITNIPVVTNVPFFRAVPYNPIPVADQATADALNAAYAAYNAGIEQARLGMAISDTEAERRTINFAPGANAFVMTDEDLTDLTGSGLPNIRQTAPSDLVVLPAAAAFATGVGTQTAAGDNLVVTPEEQTAIITRTVAFNTIIATAVANSGGRFVLYDTNSGIAGVSPNTAIGAFADVFGLDGSLGIVVNGVRLQPDFSPNGIFSTDGVHPNQRGYAILAEEMLKVIEASFGATLPDIDVLDRPGVTIAQ